MWPKMLFVSRSYIKIRAFDHFEIYQDKRQQSLSQVDPKLSTSQTSKLIEIKLSEKYQLFKFISDYPTHITLQISMISLLRGRFRGCSGENFPNLTAKKAKNDKSDKIKIFVSVPINTIPMVSPINQIKDLYDR